MQHKVLKFFLSDQILSERKPGSEYRMVSRLVFWFICVSRQFLQIHAGQCVVTLGTGPGFDNRWRDIQLLSSHSYAVIGEFLVSKSLLFKLSVYDRRAWNGRRPYVHCSGFLGSFSWWREGSIKCVLSYSVECPSWALTGTLQISWSEVINTFDGVYLSWDPGMWQHSLTFHGYFALLSFQDSIYTYQSSKECGNAVAKTINMVAIYSRVLCILYSLAQGSRQVQLEFSTSSAFNEEIWVLLTRHVTDTHRTSDFIALKVEIEDELIPISRVVGNQYILSSQVCCRVSLCSLRFKLP